MKLNYLLLLTLVLFSACRQTSPKLLEAEALMKNKADSALAILQAIDYNTLDNNNDKAFYGILLFNALDKNDMDLKPDSIINFSINYYNKTNNNEKLAIALFYKARVFKYAYHLDEASKLYFKALDNLIKSENYDLKGKIYSDLGDIDLSQNNFKEVRVKYKKSMFCFDKVKNNYNALVKYVDIGKTYRFEKNYTRSKMHFTTALTKTNDSLLVGLILQELGLNYFLVGKFDSAIVCLKRSTLYPAKGNNLSIKYFMLSDSYFNLKSYDSAIHYSKKSLECPANHYTRREIYRILANTEYQLKHPEAMGEYMKKYQEHSDSIQLIEKQTKTDVIEKIHLAEKQVHSKDKQLILLILTALILISAVIIVYFKAAKYKKLNKKFSRELTHSLNDTLQKIEQNELQLQQNLKDIIAKNRALQSELRKNLSLEERDRLDVEIYEKTLEINNREAFYQKMNNIYSNFISWLQKQHPDITDKEILFCSLEIIEIPNNHKIILLQTTENGLYKLKQRLAKKMNLSSTKDLNHYLKTRCAVTE